MRDATDTSTEDRTVVAKEADSTDGPAPLIRDARASARKLGILFGGRLLGFHIPTSAYKPPHVRHQGDKERARRQRQKERAEAKIARRTTPERTVTLVFPEGEFR